MTRCRWMIRVNLDTAYIERISSAGKKDISSKQLWAGCERCQFIVAHQRSRRAALSHSRDSRTAQIA